MQRITNGLLFKNSLKLTSSRLYSTEVTDSKSAKLQVLKESRERALKNKIEEKLKLQKQREEKRKQIREEKEEIKAKNAEIRKMAQQKDKFYREKVQNMVKRKVEQQKRSTWVKKQKEKEKDEWKTLRDKLKNKGKRVKDPKAPIRPKNAFLWFYTKNFTEIKETLGTVKSAVDVMKEANKKFKTLSDDQKKPFLLLAQEDKARYDTERKRYVSSKKSSTRIQTPYIRFFIETQPKLRSENPKAKVTELAQMVAGKWKALPEEEKKKYQDAYARDKQVKLQNEEKKAEESE